MSFAKAGREPGLFVVVLKNCKKGSTMPRALVRGVQLPKMAPHLVKPLTRAFMLEQVALLTTWQLRPWAPRAALFKEVAALSRKRHFQENGIFKKISKFKKKSEFECFEGALFWVFWLALCGKVPPWGGSGALCGKVPFETPER